ncbi:MAG: S8 family serine peptidase [Kiritimatiellae bacterium]|nr:S8 family serine peptidase [Kiritimatiellia bacterium]
MQKIWILAPMAMLVALLGLWISMAPAPTRSASPPPAGSSLPKPSSPDHSPSRVVGVRRPSAGPAPERRWLIADRHEVGEEEALNVVPNEWIVSMRKGTSAETLASRLGATITGRMSVGHTFRFQFPDAASAAAARLELENDASVLGIESNHVIPRPTIPVPSTMAAMPVASAANLRIAPVDSETPIVIGLVDTAVGAGDRGAEEFLLGAAVSSPAPTHGNSVLAAILDGLAAAAGERAASSVRVVPVDVYGDAEDTTSYQVAEGILAAMEQGATVINLSLGTSTPVRLLQDLIDAGDLLGVVFVGAAGNEPVDTPTYPAAHDAVLAVTSMDDTGHVADHVNYGAFVDVGAPGAVRFPYGEGWYVATGTSISAGFVSGLTAGVAERAGISVAEAKEKVAEMLALEPDP